MNELEQIEIWRNQFESAIKKTALECDTLEKDYMLEQYINASTEALWQGFLLARISMPVIELPELFDDPDGCQLFSGSVTGAIEAAGYKYKIKV